MPDETDIRILTGLLERLQAEPRPDELARMLISRYGTLASLLESPTLYGTASGLPENHRMLLSMIPGLVRQRTLDRLGPNPLLHSLERAAEFAAALYSGAQYEQVCLLCLDGSLRLKEHYMLSEGGLREVAFYPRRLMQLALSVKADSILLCHNHPSGWCFFSEDDLASTREFLRLCTQIGLSFVDHLLIANEKYSSLRSRTYIPDKLWTATGPYVPSLPHWRRETPPSHL